MSHLIVPLPRLKEIPVSVYITRGPFVPLIVIILNLDRKKIAIIIFALSQQSTSERDERIVTYTNLYASTQAL